MKFRLFNYGFIASAVAGFLLTAVPSWTGQKGFAGRPLMLLSGLWLAAAAAVIQGWRLSQWATHRTLGLPIVWVLHLAYIWLTIGLTLKALAILLQPAFAAFWLHALTIGALTTMIVGVMTRAALVRVFGLAVLGLNYVTVIALAGLCWTVAFALFVAVYAPILWGPRADGKAG